MIHLEIDDEDRDLLLMALGQMTSTSVAGNREHALTLIKRVAASQHESEVATLDVSSNVWYCNECHVRGPSETFEHRPGCRWVARYG